LAASTTPYTVSATYVTDTDLLGAGPTSATTGLTVSKDSTSLVVSETPSTVTYNAENAAVFTVNINPTNGENLPAIENVVVTVGTTSCTAAVQINTTGTCSIANSILPPSGTAYAVSAAYLGDGDITASSGTLSGGLMVTKFAPAVTVTNTANPTGISTGNLVLTATVSGTGTTGPTGTLTWTIAGGTVSTCSATTALAVQGTTGTSTATCTINTPAAGTYTAKAVYGGDTNYSGLTSPSTFGAYIGQTAATVPTGTYYYTINNASSTGSTTNTANPFNPGSGITLTSISMTFNGGAPSGSNQTVTVGKITGSTYTATSLTCTVLANTGESCTLPTTYTIPNGSSVNMGVVGNNLHTDFWIVTYTNP
jgi:hypothetical protein